MARQANTLFLEEWLRICSGSSNNTSATTNQSQGSSSGNNDQMSMEDSMAEDTVQATTPSVCVFSQQPATPGSIFGFSAPSGGNQFGSTGPSRANPFQFGSQTNIPAPQNPSFQASGSLEFNAGGSFSLFTGGGDKSLGKFVRVKKTQRKR
jgi:hypothetical protein|uniref:Uncharacterized protein n=2 Tax=Populus TaxID=3689 RepID=U7DZ86_POPTR